MMTGYHPVLALLLTGRKNGLELKKPGMTLARRVPNPSLVSLPETRNGFMAHRPRVPAMKIFEAPQGASGEKVTSCQAVAISLTSVIPP